MLIDQPTRYTINTATILDQFIVTPTLRAGNVSITPPLATTDHCQISCNISIDLPLKTTLSRHIWLYSEADWEGIGKHIYTGRMLTKLPLSSRNLLLTPSLPYMTEISVVIRHVT